MAAAPAANQRPPLRGAGAVAVAKDTGSRSFPFGAFVAPFSPQTYGGGPCPVVPVSHTRSAPCGRCRILQGKYTAVPQSSPDMTARPACRDRTILFAAQSRCSAVPPVRQGARWRRSGRAARWWRPGAGPGGGGSGGGDGPGWDGRSVLRLPRLPPPPLQVPPPAHRLPAATGPGTGTGTMSVAGLKKQFYKATQVRHRHPAPVPAAVGLRGGRSSLGGSEKPSRPLLPRRCPFPAVIPSRYPGAGPAGHPPVPPGVRGMSRFSVWLPGLGAGRERSSAAGEGRPGHGDSSGGSGGCGAGDTTGVPGVLPFP